MKPPINRRLAILGACTLLSLSANAVANCAILAADASCALHAVSLIRLIANPADYDGKRVRVVGFMNIEFEGNALYLHREDFQRGLSENSLALHLPEAWPLSGSNCRSRTYALIEGTFSAARRGHMGLLRSGGVEAISRCSRWR